MSALPLGPLAEIAARDPHGVALVDANGVRVWTSVLSDLTGAASALLEAAPDPDQRWGILGDNVSPTLIAHAAALLAGVGAVAVSRQLTVPELTDQVQDAGMVGLISGPGGAETSMAMLEAGLVSTVVLHSMPAPAREIPGVVMWDQWIAAAPLREDFPVRPARPAMVYTSGTTGRARGTQTRWVIAPVDTHLDYLAKLRERAQFPEGPHIVVGPLQHNGPLTAVRHLLLGQPVIIVGKFDAAEVLGLIERYRVASSVMVPTHFQRLLAAPADVRATSDVSSLKLVAHTGSACPPDVKRAMIDWFGPVFTESYGGSESGTLCRINSTEWLEHPGSVGRAVEPYRQDEEKTAKAYIRPNAFTLGDMGHVDAEGFIYVTDRVSDMVVSGGVNLYPSESEQALRQAPGVADVAVIGIPHRDLGEQLLALVVASDASNPPAAADLQDFCRELISSYKIPRVYEFVAELPRNEMQKVDKKALRKPYWASDRTIAG